MSERDNLETHVDLCELRYKQLQAQLNSFEGRLHDVGDAVREVKDQSEAQFNIMKDLLQTHADEKFKTMITATATIIVGLSALLGYLLLHLSK